MSDKLNYVIEDDLHGKRLDQALSILNDGISRSTLGQYIKDGLVTVDDKAITKPSVKVSSGQEIVITLPEAEDLLSYIDRNIPVAVIATPDLITPSRGDSWITPDGRTVTWQKGHHCLVLIGYDKTRSKVYFSDPARSAGNGVSVFDFGRFKQIYDMKGKNAMIIDTGSVNVPKKTLKVGDKVHYVGWINRASEGNGNEIYVDNTEKEYTVTFIHTSTALPNRVCLDQLGWVSIDAITQNTAYYGNGDSSGNSTPSEPAEKNPPSTAVSEIKDGNVYNIVNLYSDYFLNVDNGIDKDGTNIYQWRPDQSTEQKFKMSADSDSWKIKSMSS